MPKGAEEAELMRLCIPSSGVGWGGGRSEVCCARVQMVH